MLRLLKNKFFEDVESLESSGASNEKVSELLGRGRAKLGMFDGNKDDGEMEIGQVSAFINQILSVSEIFDELIMEYRDAYSGIGINPRFIIG